MLVFSREGKPEYPEKTSQCREENQQTLNPHMTPDLGIGPGSHQWEASALTIAQSLHPIKKYITNKFSFSP